MAVIRARAADIEPTYTNEEFEALPEYNENYELVDGKLVKREVPNTKHGWIASKLNKAINLFDPDDQLGATWFDTSLVLADGIERIPDLMFFRVDNLPAIENHSIRVAPDIAVEVVSPSDLKSKPNRDAYYGKIYKYQELGVALVWVIIPELQIIEVYQPESITPIKVLGIDDELEGGKILPGFKLKLSKLFS